MKSAPLTADEAARLALLSAISILDSGPEDQFDRITALAAKLLKTPVALVSLIDSQRQWFKSKHGIDVAETPRELAFCAHAIHSKETFIVPDALQDERFFDNPLVAGAPHIRFYAGVPLSSADGVALGTLCVLDVEPRRMLAEEEAVLRDLAAVVSRELAYRELTLRAQGALIFQLEIDAGRRPRFTFAGNGLAELFGATQAELLADADRFFGLIHAQDRPALEGLLCSVDDTTGRVDVRLLLPGRKSPLWLQIQATARCLPGGGKQWNGQLADVSQQRELDQQLRENDRLQITTVLATGIAHDFNNILGSMIGLAELCRDQTDVGTRLHHNLQRIHDSGQKAAALIRQMLDYARQSPLELRVARLSEVVRRLVPLVQVTLPARVDIALSLGDDPAVLADAPQIEQVVHNLVRNAAYAMKDSGGTVHVEIDGCPADASPLGERSCRLAVSDTGCGIAPDNLAQIFDPFYTSKPVGEGTGLGLSSAQGIVSGHGGVIEVDSVEGSGSRFTVWLPAVRAEETLLPA